MNTQSAAQSKPDQKPGSSEQGAAQAGASLAAVPSRTRRFFFHFEIGVKKTASKPGRPAGLQPQEAPIAQPVLAFSTGLPKPPVPEGVLGVPQAPAGGSGSTTSTAAAYVQLSVGETVTPPDGYPGPPQA